MGMKNNNQLSVEAGRHDRGLGKRGAMAVRSVGKDDECGGTQRWATNNDDNIIVLTLPAPPTQQSNYEVTLRRDPERSRGQGHEVRSDKEDGR